MRQIWRRELLDEIWAMLFYADKEQSSKHVLGGCWHRVLHEAQSKSNMDDSDSISGVQSCIGDRQEQELSPIRRGTDPRGGFDE